MSLINGSWSVSSIISDVLPEEFEKVEADELILSDNERLRGRVEELEKIVVMQRNEIMLLQASMADILRRVQNLESKPGQYNSLPRPSRLTGSRSTYSAHNPMSKSMHSESASPNRRQSIRASEMVNVPIGKSARGSPMRKWVSSQEIPPTPPDPRSRRISTATNSSSEEASTSGLGTPIVNRIRRISINHDRNSNITSSQLSLSSLTSTITRKNPHTCRPSNGTLPIFVGGKTVNIQVPNEFEDFDPNQEQDPPNIKATLKHVYSFRGKDVRANIELLPTGEILFFSANFVIMMTTEGVQRIYHGHTSDVKCIALHPNKIIVASGQSTCHTSEKALRTEHISPIESPDELVKQLEMEHTEAHIRIWDSVKLQTLLIIGGFDVSFEKGISQLAFSNSDSGVHLACIDDSLKHTMTIWKWQKAKKVAEVKAANDTVFEMKWHPTIKNLIVLFGKGHFSFFNFDANTGMLMKTCAQFEGRDKPKTVLSMCFGKEGQIITGDSNGTISIWDMKTYRTIKQAHSVHPGGVYSLCITKSGKLLSGGKDRMISEWEVDSLVRSKRPVELPDDRGFARTILPMSPDSLIVGTSTNSLLVGHPENLGSLIEGDTGELSSMITCGSTHIMTGSKCGILRRWNIMEKKIEWSKKYMGSIECLDVDSSMTHVIVGFLSGSWQVINMTNQETIEDHREGASGICCVKFAPVGGTFAVCTKDPLCTIYRIDASRNLINLAKIHQIPSPISHLDWSKDGQTIRAQTIGYNLLHWTRTGEPASQKGGEWLTSNCSLSFETCLVAHSSNGQINTTSKCEEINAIGMENGTTRIYSNPVTSLTAGFVELVGHPKSVKSLSFASKNSLLTMSPIDNSIFEWSIEYN